jgi:Tol biopolymer transport system component
VSGVETGHKWRCYAVDVATGRTSALSPEGVRGARDRAPASPDGRRLLVRDERDEGSSPRTALYSIESGRLEPTNVPKDVEGPATWSPDGRAFFAHRHDDSGAVGPVDRVGILIEPEPIINADGRLYVYSYARFLTDLYLVNGLR